MTLRELPILSLSTTWSLGVSVCNVFVVNWLTTSSLSPNSVEVCEFCWIRMVDYTTLNFVKLWYQGSSTTSVTTDGGVQVASVIIMSLSITTQHLSPESPVIFSQEPTAKSGCLGYRATIPTQPALISDNPREIKLYK